MVKGGKGKCPEEKNKAQIAAQRECLCAQACRFRANGEAWLM